MRLTRAEQETVIRWDEEDRTVILWTASRSVMRRLEQKGIAPSREGRFKDGTLHGKEYLIPPNRFSWRTLREPSAKQVAARQKGAVLLAERRSTSENLERTGTE